MTCLFSLAGNIVFEMCFLIEDSSVKTRPLLSFKVGEMSGKNLENPLYAHIPKNSFFS
jgi:hypothetical protein